MAKYYKADREAVRKKREALSTGKYWEPREGKNQIRICPPWNEEGVWWFELALHYGFKDEEDRNRAYPCFRQWKNLSCPTCDAISIIKKEDGGKKVVERMNARTKYYVNLIDRRVGEDRIFIWGMSSRLLNELSSYDDDEDYGDVTDPKEGFDFIIERTGSGLKTKYNARIKPKPTKLGDIGDLYDLEAEVPNDISQREMAQLLSSQFREFLEDSEFDPDDYGKKKKKDEEGEEPRKKKKKKKKDDDED